MKHEMTPMEWNSETSSNEPLPQDLFREIDSLTSVDQCLTLARLYLRRAKELSHQRIGLLERGLPLDSR